MPIFTGRVTIMVCICFVGNIVCLYN